VVVVVVVVDTKVVDMVVVVVVSIIIRNSVGNHANILKITAVVVVESMVVTAVVVIRLGSGLWFLGARRKRKKRNLALSAWRLMLLHEMEISNIKTLSLCYLFNALIVLNRMIYSVDPRR
jgi:hypothetical protein